MKNNKLSALRDTLPQLKPAEEQQVKGGYGRIPGTRVNSRTSRWDDIPFRLVRPRTEAISKELTGSWSGLVKDSPFRP
jgi:hypothetical protein